MKKHLSVVAEKDKKTKREAGYHAANHFCGACMFYEGDDRPEGACEKVKGTVEYDGGCKLFQAIVG